MSLVALVRCESYDPPEVRKGLERAFALLGGPERFVKKGEKILLKPNLLAAAPPEKCVTTHPAVFRAAAEILADVGARLTYGDSPAVGSTTRCAEKAGIVEEARRLGLAAADFARGETVSFEMATQNRRFVLARGVLDAEGIVSLPKFKTHGLEKVTGALKNQFGCIPGMRKAEFHMKLPDAFDFARMLVDLTRFVRPRLYVLDAVWAMEGNGPRNGKPRKLSVLALSDDCVALDATACRLIGLDPGSVPTIRLGEECGAGTSRESRIRVVGDELDSLKVADFDVDRGPVRPFRRMGLSRFVTNRLVARPCIAEERCVKCGVCVETCPARPKALAWPGGDRSAPPAYDSGRCIRCYCCQEVCPEGAIRLEEPLARKALNLFARGRI